MSSGQKRALQSDGVGETFSPPADLIRIAEEDPTHPHHHEHTQRMSLDDPENQALLNSFREFGWRKSVTMAVFLDGDGYSVSDGRRRLTMLRIVNGERKAARDKRGQIRPRVVIDDQPALTTTLTNSMRKDDPPLVKARRFLDNRESMGPQAAARAAGFLTIAEANQCAAILQVPDATLHAAVNSGAVTVDTAARAAKKGQGTVRKVLERSRATGNGKVTEKGAKEAVRAEVKPRPRMRPAPHLSAVETKMRAALPASEATDHGLMLSVFIEAMVYFRGGPAPEWAREYTEIEEQGRKAKKGGGK